MLACVCRKVGVEFFHERHDKKSKTMETNPGVDYDDRRAGDSVHATNRPDTRTIHQQWQFALLFATIGDFDGNTRFEC